MDYQKKLRINFLEQTSQQQKVLVPVFLDELSGNLLEEQLNELVALDVLLKGRKRQRQTQRCESAQYITITNDSIFRN